MLPLVWWLTQQHHSGVPREARGRTAAGRARREGMVPTVLQGQKQPEILMEVNAKRLGSLRRRHLLKQSQVLQVSLAQPALALLSFFLCQLDWLGELIAVYPKAVPLDPVSGAPTSLVLCRAPVTPEQVAHTQRQAATAALPPPLLPLGWHPRADKKD